MKQPKKYPARKYVRHATGEIVRAKPFKNSAKRKFYWLIQYENGHISALPANKFRERYSAYIKPRMKMSFIQKIISKL